MVPERHRDTSRITVNVVAVAVLIMLPAKEAPSDMRTLEYCIVELVFGSAPPVLTL